MQTAFNQLHEILAALNLIDDLPLDQDLARLIRLARSSEPVASFVRLAGEEPARLDALWEEGTDQLIEELRSTGIPWSKIHRLVPQLAMALKALEQS